jgi:ABC-type transport system substrate-binding protein
MEYLVELPDNIFNKYIGESPEGFQSYGQDESLEEQALEKLESIGYTKEDGEVLDPQGEQLTIEILAPAEGTWVLNAQTLASNLSNFGIDASIYAKEGAAYGEDMNENDYQIAVNSWGVGGDGWFHAYNFFQYVFSSWRSEADGYDRTAIEVPMPVGNAEGDLESVNTADMLEQVAKLPNGAEQRSVLKELAWVNNQFLPRIPINYVINRQVHTVDDWDVPRNKNLLRANSHATLGRNAAVSSK